MGSFLPLSFLKSGEAAKTKKNVVVGCSPENVLSKWFLQGAICKHNPNILLSSFESAKNSPNSRPDTKDLDLSDCDVHVVFSKKDLKRDEQIISVHSNLFDTNHKGI